MLKYAKRLKKGVECGLAHLFAKHL